MKLSRRAFCNLVGGLALTAHWASPLRLCAAEAVKGDAIIVGSMQDACFIDLAAQTLTHVPLGFMAHSFIQHPTKKNTFLAIEKWGPHAAEVDFTKQKVTKPIRTPEGTWFYGHGVYREEDKAFYITRVDLKTGLGHLVAHEGDEYAPTHSLQVAAGGLHECHFLPDRTLLVTSSGIRSYGDGQPQAGTRVEKTALVHVDMNAGRVLSRMDVDNEDQILGHFRISNHGPILALSGARPAGKDKGGRLYFAEGAGKAFRMVDLGDDVLSRIQGEMLSIALDEDRRVAAVTNPVSEIMLLVDMQTGQLKEKHKDDALGVVYDKAQRAFVATGTGVKKIAGDFLKNEPLNITTGFKNKKRMLDGAHALYVSHDNRPEKL